MSRRTVRVQLDRYSARVTGPKLRPLLDRAGCRWHWDPYTHKAVSVHHADVDDFIVVAELAGYLVELIGRDGRPEATGGLLGGVA
jgi:hypothetical protein